MQHRKTHLAPLWALAAAIFACAAVGCAAGTGGDGDGDGDGDEDKAHLHLTFQALPELGPGAVYEAFALSAGDEISVGRFQANAEQQVFGFDTDAATIDNALGVKITIEQKDGDDPEASDMVLLAGDFDGEAMDAQVSDARALGADFANSNAGFILDTPSTSAVDDAKNGVWFQSPSGSRALDLPELSPAFIYEGWVIAGGTEYSTGRFRNGDAEDDDLAGPDAGSDSGHARPGQDFVSSMLDLTAAGTVVGISIEPVLDTAPERFSNLIFSGDPTTWTADNLVGMTFRPNNLPTGQFLKAEAGSHDELHDHGE